MSNSSGLYLLVGKDQVVGYIESSLECVGSDLKVSRIEVYLPRCRINLMRTNCFSMGPRLGIGIIVNLLQSY